MRKTILFFFLGLINCGLADNSSQKNTTTTKYICDNFIILSNGEVDPKKKKELEEDYLKCKTLNAK